MAKQNKPNKPVTSNVKPATGSTKTTGAKGTQQTANSASWGNRSSAQQGGYSSSFDKDSNC